MPIAALPMYDWPEIEGETDRFWERLRGRLEADDIPAPRLLSRSRDPEAEWLSPDLLFSQTCGYPFSTVLKGRVMLVGTPAYAIDTPAGQYFSAIVMRHGDEAKPVAQLATGRFAYNARNSQSGFRAPMRWLASKGVRHPAAVVETGSHRASIRAVAEGRADFAAIDAVSWALALRHEPAAKALTVAARTPATPGLPFITAERNTALRGRIAEAVAAAIAGLDDTVRQALLLTGFVRTEAADYAGFADGTAPAAAE
jgi:ABC-type phosphate/phosphonate transport system substrate-binding protein